MRMRRSTRWVSYTDEKVRAVVAIALPEQSWNIDEKVKAAVTVALADQLIFHNVEDWQ